MFNILDPRRRHRLQIAGSSHHQSWKWVKLILSCGILRRMLATSSSGIIHPPTNQPKFLPLPIYTPMGGGRPFPGTEGKRCTIIFGLQFISSVHTCLLLAYCYISTSFLHILLVACMFLFTFISSRFIDHH